MATNSKETLVCDQSHELLLIVYTQFFMNVYKHPYEAATITASHMLSDFKYRKVPGPKEVEQWLLHYFSPSTWRIKNG